MLPSISPDSELLGILNLHFPGNPLPSTNFSHVWSLFVVSSTLSLSLRKLLNPFSKHLIGFPSTDEITFFELAP